MLYIQDQSGTYLPASKETVFTEARKLSSYRLRRGTVITSPAEAKEAIGIKLTGLEYELFACLFLDSKHQVLAWREMFRGSVNRTSVHPREIVKEALGLNASAVILAHNHPSGSIEPSSEDVELTRTLTEILKVIDVRVLDHLIIGDEITALSETGHHTA